MTAQSAKTECSFTRIKPQEAFSEKRSRHIYFMEDNLLHAMSKLHVYFHVVTKFCRIFYSIVQTTNIEIRKCVKWSLTRGLKRLKNNENSLTVRPKRWSRSLTGGGRLLEVPTVRLWLGKFWCFGKAFVYRRWSLTRGGRTWSLDCIWIPSRFHFAPPHLCVKSLIQDLIIHLFSTE